MSKFTRRHYEAVAKVMAKNFHKDGERGLMRLDITQQFADMFEDDNPAFRRGTFFKACESSKD